MGFNSWIVDRIVNTYIEYAVVHEHEYVRLKSDAKKYAKTIAKKRYTKPAIETLYEMISKYDRTSGATANR